MRDTQHKVTAEGSGRSEHSRNSKAGGTGRSGGFSGSARGGSDPRDRSGRADRTSRDYSGLWQKIQPASGPVRSLLDNIRSGAGKYLELYRPLYFEEFLLLFAAFFQAFVILTYELQGDLAMVMFLLWGVSVILPVIAYFREIPQRLLFRRAPARILMAYAAAAVSLYILSINVYHLGIFRGLFSLAVMALLIELLVHWTEYRLLSQAMSGEMPEWSSPRDKTLRAIAEAGYTRNRVEREVQERLKSEQLRTELITNISHDIRTPLTSIINFTELLKGEKLAPEARDYLLVVDKSAHRMEVMVEDLFTATKTASGHLEVAIETVDFSEVLMQTYAPLDNLFQEKGLELDYDRRDATLAIKADGTHLSRVIQNLLINAVNYSVRDTRVYVRVREEAEAFRIRLTNISRQKLDITPTDLMEQFVRGDESRQTEGSGLGLYIATNLMELMGGSLSLDIEGDVFSAELTLPKGIDETIGLVV